MGSLRSLVCLILLLSATAFCLQSDAARQEDEAVTATTGVRSVPRAVRFNGVIDGNSDQMVTLTFALYGERLGGAPLWTETQNVRLDQQGRYSVLLGAVTKGGMPLRLFATGEARWLGVRVAEEGAVEQPRVALVSVPYALAAADAQSLNGRPATDYQLTRAAALASGDAAAAGVETSGAVSSGPNTVNRVAKFTGVDTVGDSAITESGGLVGIGTTASSRLLSVFDASGGRPFKVLQQNTASTNPAAEVVSAGTSALDVANWDNAGSKWILRTFRNVSRGESADVAIDGSPAFVFGVRADGNVGIGTMFPSRKLTVYDNTTTGRPVKVLQENAGSTFPAVEVVSAGTSVMDLGNWDNSGTKWVLRTFRNVTRGDTENIVGTGAPEQILGVRADGRVGVGTTVPSRKLSVYDNSAEVLLFKVLQQNAASLTPAAEVVSAGSSALDVANWDQSASKWIFRAYSNASRAEEDVVSAAGVPALALGVRADGNVGIGTTSPSQKLEVAGTVYSTTGGFKFPDGSVQTTAVTGGGGVNGSCPAGQFVRAISGGGVTCAADQTVGLNLPVSATGSTSSGAFTITQTNSIVLANEPTFSFATTSIPAAVAGVANPSAGNTAVGVVGFSNSVNSPAIVGWNGATGQVGQSTDAQGVIGQSEAIGGTGVEGNSNATTGTGAGVKGQSRSPNGVGVHGANNAGGLAGEFDGNVTVNGTLRAQAFQNTGGAMQVNNGLNVTGNLTVSGNISGGSLTKPGGTFKIDHPLDPANKYLYHSFVESPDMMNIYNGVVMLDAKGEAWVAMPEWFEALNMEFRYQLTAIGRSMPKLYVAAEMSSNRFKIAGGKANAKVSWQVTGIRHDAWANDHRVVVEVQKSTTEQGTYIYPEHYQKPVVAKK